LFLHFPDDPMTFSCQTEFLLGADLLVAPVLDAGALVWPVYLPEGCDWIHIWSGMTRMGGQTVTVACPIGEPPLFARVGSVDAALLAGIAGV
jgi:alpha-glucosidase